MFLIHWGWLAGSSPEVPLGPVKSSFLQKQEVLCPGCKQTHLRLQSCLGRRVGGRVSPSDISLSSLLSGPSQWG